MWRSLVSAPALGAGGRRFESGHPDQNCRSEDLLCPVGWLPSWLNEAGRLRPRPPLGSRLGRCPDRAAVMPVIPAIFGSGPPWWLARPGGRLDGVELLIARNPDPDSRLPYLLLLPLAGGMVF